MLKKKIFIMSALSSLLIILIITGIFLYYIMTPSIVNNIDTYVSTDGWSNLSNDIKPVSKKIEITNAAENATDVEVRVIDSLNFFKGSRIVQVKAINMSGNYKFSIRHAIK
ncbi:MAG: hypothetical protein KHY44_15130 [Clostridiales bacterium]|jgi:thymidine kinase|nr:hypothetical protein [Clostridiales bacterium]